MSEHREHLLPDTEDISCRGALIVGLHADMRQRIYLRPVQAVPGRRSSRAALVPS